MSLIEGIGDDVLCVFGLFIFTGIIFLAWLSTRVNHIHFPTSMFFIERQQQRNDVRESDYQTSSISSERESSPNVSSTSLPSGHETRAERTSENACRESDGHNLEDISLTPPPTTAQCTSPNPDDSQRTTMNDDESPSFRIIFKFLNETRKEILAHPNDTIQKLKQLHFADELSNNKTIRFIYQGRELGDQEILHTCNIRDLTTIHCQISTRRSDSTRSRNNGTSSQTHANSDGFHTTFIESPPVNISSYFVFLLLIFFGLIWFLRIKYRALFSPISTVVLILMTLLFLIFSCGPFLVTYGQTVRVQRSTTVTNTPVQPHAHAD